MKKNLKIEYKDEVETPEGVGEVQEESTFGEFRIQIPGKGFRWYFPEDLNVVKKGKRAKPFPQPADDDPGYTRIRKGGDNLDRSAKKIQE